MPDQDLPSQSSVVEEYKRLKVGGTWFYLKLYKPSNFSPSRRYPVIFDLYGGPTKNKVSTKYQRGYAHYFAGRYGTLYVRVDVRGTPGRSDNFQYSLHQQVGVVEVEDTVSVIAALRRLPYIDPSRVAISGASYGGYLVLKVLQAAPHLFRAAVSAAAVTDWRYYDTAYTERYLGLYNETVYDRAGVLGDVDKIPNHVLLLLHGLCDKNVLIRHHWELVRRLNKHNKIYSHFVKPARGHKLPRLLNMVMWFKQHLWEG